MDWVMIAVIAAVILLGMVITAYIITNTINSQMSDLYAMLIEKELKSEVPPSKSHRKEEPPKSRIEGETVTRTSTGSNLNEEELLRKLKQAINEKVQNVLEEGKRKKERILMLLDMMRGYALGYISEDEYNAFLMKILGELDEFKRLWLARFPSQKDKEKLNQMINYISRTKLPIVVRSKNGKEQMTLPPEEALIRATSHINSALDILDELIKARGENPAVTPLEIKLSKECETLRAKVEKLERQLEEYSALT